jgi:tellurite resistance protein TerC
VGGDEAYLAAYLLEKSLSVDNLFVFSVIFTRFAVSERDRYHVLFYGVIGAIAFRAIFVLSGTALLSAFTWLVFGAFLIFTGLRMLRRTSAEGEQADY